MKLEGDRSKQYWKFEKVLSALTHSACTLTYFILISEEEQQYGPEKGPEDEEDPINPLVDALFDEVENLRLQVCVFLNFCFELSFLLFCRFSNLK